MSTKIYYNEEKLLDSFFEEYSFSHANGINMGNTEGVVSKLIMHSSMVTGLTSKGLPKFTQTIEIQFYSGLEREEFDSAIETIPKGYEYRKANLSHGTFEDLNEETPTNKAGLFKKSHSYYNFKLPNYENASKTVEESSMPCFLFAINNQVNDSTYSRLLVSNYITNPAYTNSGNGNVNFIYDANMIGSKKAQEGNQNKYLFNWYSTYNFSNNYYSSFADNFMTDDNFSTQCEKIFCTHDQNKISLYSKLKSYHVPYYNYIVFPSFGGGSTSIREALRDELYLSNILLNRLSISEPDIINGDTLIFDLDKILSYEQISETPEGYGFENINSISIYPEANNQDYIQSIETVLLGELENNIEELYQNHLASLSHSKMVDIADMTFNQTDCHSEIIGCRVVKTREGRQRAVQDIFFGLSGNSSLKFLDSQIRYDTGYTYTFYYIYAMIGYSYTQRPAQTFGDSAFLTYEIEPKIYIVHQNIGTKNMHVLEPPPRVPLIKFSNYVNKNNQIKITATDRLGVTIEDRNRHELKIISNSDNLYKSNLATYCNSLYPYYSSVSSYGIFEVYRLETKPMSLQDFDGNLVQIISNDIADRFGRKRNKSTSIAHYLEHGKKYYYLFRAITHQGNYSNPTAVYEVEKIKNADDTVLNVRTIKLESEQRTSYNRSFRKFLKLSIPNYHLAARSIISSNSEEADTAIGSNVELALGEDFLDDDLWRYNSLTGSHIKLRVESKSTGKKIDLNLIFNYNQPKNN